MPDFDTTKRPDLTDLADDDVRSLKDTDVRNALYEVTQKIKRIMEYQEDLILALYDEIVALKKLLP